MAQGQNEGILNVKNGSANVKDSMVLDYERGQSDVILPHPWQTDTCIGEWHYKRSIFENHQYKTPDQVVKTLVDIVSKNGNLLLNIPIRGDGTIDSDEVAFLEGMAAWMAVNKESIFATRPWKIPGEGPVKVKGGGFSEGGRPYTAQDFRFATKGNVLYATAMAWPDDGKLTIKTLSSTRPGFVGKVKSVSLLGSPEKLAWSRLPTAWPSRYRRRSPATTPTPSRSPASTWPRPGPRRRPRPRSTPRRTAATR